ncbi:MAG: DNA primase [Desulfobacterales bacterium]|nr:DNA primase [Desulfobacterales bacterium]
MASFIPEEKISEIKNAADIVDIVSESVLLKKAGRNYLGLCPFHSEKTPSFTVSPEKQIFHCFGCGAGGNVFKFLMQQEGASFPEAVKMVARRCGVETPGENLTPAQKKRMTERENLLLVNKHGMEFFHGALTKGAAGKKARAYLAGREISEEIISEFNLGYAPAGWDNLFNYLSRKRIPPGLIETAGLVAPRKNASGFYDRFRDRIIFPIMDIGGRVVGFGGRVMDDAMPKYLNSPETPVYNKSRCLYGLNRTKPVCRKTGAVHIVEGYVDLLALYRCGVKNVVATLGTALTPEHVRLLKGHARKMLLVFDSDAAGIKAAERSIGIFMREAVDARIIVLPEGYDPDSYVTRFGAEGFSRAAENALSVISFLIDSAIKKHGLGLEGKIRIVADLKQPLAAVNDSVARSLYIKELAERIGIDETAILKKIREASARPGSAGRGSAPAGVRPGPAGRGGPPSSAGPGPAPSPREKPAVRGEGFKLEQSLISMMLQFPGMLGNIKERGFLDFFEDPALKSIGAAILSKGEGMDKKTLISELLDGMSDGERHDMVASLAMEDEENFQNSKRRLKLIDQYEEFVIRRKSTLSQRIKAAEKQNDHELVLKLLKDKQSQISLRQP